MRLRGKEKTDSKDLKQNEIIQLSEVKLKTGSRDFSIPVEKMIFIGLIFLSKKNRQYNMPVLSFIKQFQRFYCVI